MIQAEDDAGIRAELSDTHRDRLDVRGGDIVRARCQRAWQENHRIDAAHFRVDRDRIRPGCAGVEQCPTATERAGERDRPGCGMPDKRQAGFVGDAVEHRKDPGRQAFTLDRGSDGFGNQFARARVGGMRLDDDGQPAASAPIVSFPATDIASGKLLAPKTTTGPIGINIDLRSGFGAGLRSRSGRSIRADTHAPSRATSAKMRTPPIIRVRSFCSRFFGRPVSA